MAAMSETTFLADISKWAVQGHIDFVNEFNDSMDQIAAHARSTVTAHDAVDQDSAKQISSVLNLTRNDPTNPTLSA